MYAKIIKLFTRRAFAHLPPGPLARSVNVRHAMLCITFLGSVVLVTLASGLSNMHALKHADMLRLEAWNVVEAYGTTRRICPASGLLIYFRRMA